MTGDVAADRLSTDGDQSQDESFIDENKSLSTITQIQPIEKPEFVSK